jgi:hypothetical protein
MTLAALRTRSLGRAVGLMWLVVASVVGTTAALALTPQAVWACSAPKQSATPDISYEGVVTSVVPGSPYRYTVREDSGVTHELLVRQLPSGPDTDSGSCNVTFAVPIIGGRYVVVQRHVISGEVAAATSNGGSSYQLLAVPVVSSTTEAIAPSTSSVATVFAATRRAPLRPTEGHTGSRWLVAGAAAVTAVAVMVIARRRRRSRSRNQ